MGDDADDHLLLKENQDVFPGLKLNNFFNLLLSFLRNRLSFLAVAICLIGTLAANNSIGTSDFGESGFLFGYLEGKGGGEGQITEAMIETDYLQIKTKEDAINLLKDKNVSSKQGLVEMFDSTIGRTTVLAPFGGEYRLTKTQASVQKIPVKNKKTNTVSIMAYGYNPYRWYCQTIQNRI